MSIFEKEPSDFIKQFGIVAIVLGVLFFVTSAAQAADPAAWTSLTASGKLSNGMTLTIEEELRYSGVDMATKTSRHTDTSVSTSAEGFGFTVGYRNTNNGADRTYVGVSKSLGTVAGWDADASTTLEFFDSNTVRNRTKFSAQKVDTVAGVVPYLSTEFFITDKGDVTSNRSTVGAAKTVNASTAIDVWYQVDTDVAGDKASTDAVGVGLNISF
jgi:hypothetical protein